MGREKVLAAGKIGSGFRTTVPQEVARELGAKEGTILLWSLDDRGRVIVKKAE